MNSPSFHQKSDVRTQALERLQDLRFGIMVTWILFSGMGKEKEAAGGWGALALDEERNRDLARNFRKRASRFDADAWARAFKEAGARYIVFVPSHMLDFSLSRTRLNEFNAGRDYTGELAEACRKQGLIFGLYIHLATGMLRKYKASLGRRKAVFGKARVELGEKQDAYLDAWITEQCTQYRPAFVWLDGWTGIARAIESVGMDPYEVYDFNRIAETIRRCGPDILIGNKMVRPGLTDYRVTDHLFWANNCKEPLDNSFPSECSDVLPGNEWFAVSPEQSDFLSCDEIEEQICLYIKRLISAAGRGVNYMLNVGPLPSGELQRVETAILKGIGAWMREHGDILYGTRPLSNMDVPWGYVLARGDKVYAHILDTRDVHKARGFPLYSGGPEMTDMVRRQLKSGLPEDGRIRIGPLAKTPRRAYLRDKAAGTTAETVLPMTIETDAVTIDVSGVYPDPVDTIIELAE